MVKIPKPKTISRKLKKKQKKGIFKVPDLRNRRIIRGWLEWVVSSSEVPLVIENEKYTRSSAMKKIGKKGRFSANRNLLIVLNEYRILRSMKKGVFKEPKELVDTLSLAQTISWKYKIPIQEIHLTQEYLSSRDFKRKSPAERVKILFNGYTGIKWFETFKRRYKDYGEDVDSVYDWQNIRLRDLSEILGTSEYEPKSLNHNLVRLVNIGIVFPKKGKKFRPNNSRNFVHNEGFAQLIACLTDRDFEDVYVRDDPYFTRLVDRFIVNRVFPFLDHYQIDYNEELTTDEASEILGIKRDSVTGKIEKNVLKNTERNGRYRKINPIDLAILALKRTDKLSFTADEMSKLFGFNRLQPARLGLRKNDNNRYSRHHHVFPLYDVVAEEARKLLVSNNSSGEKYTSTPMVANYNLYYFTGKAKSSYCYAYGVSKFDNQCLEHVRKNFHKAKLNGRRLIGEEMKFFLMGRRVNSVEISWSGVDHYEEPLEDVYDDSPGIKEIIVPRGGLNV